MLVADFINLAKNGLKETENILTDGHLVVHDAVCRIVLAGSRGLQGGSRPESDIDLGLILHNRYEPTEEGCREVLETSLHNWTGAVELDAALVFDKMNCGLICYKERNYKSGLCAHGIDCIGLYKLQKGFTGFVPAIGVRIEKMYPMLIVWERGTD